MEVMKYKIELYLKKNQIIVLAGMLIIFVLFSF